MTADLSYGVPACPRESLRGFFARYVSELSHAVLDGYHDLFFFRREGKKRFLVFGPQPRRYGFFDILKGLFFITALRHTAGKSRAFGYDPSVFGKHQRNMEEHRLFSLNHINAAV
jgi:hypothetical protein